MNMPAPVRFVFVVFMLCAVIALFATGCADKVAPVPVVVYKEAAPPSVPGECDDKSDPKWRNLPRDADVTAKETIDNYKSNKRTTRTIAGKRAVCSAALREHGMIRK